MAAMTEQQDFSALENASDIIERFGGIRPMASKMGVPVTTVQGWKKRNVIPGNRRGDVIDAARSNQIDISDLLKGGAANQNAFGSAGPAAGMPGASFDSAMAQSRTTDSQTEKRHEEHVATGRATAAQDEILSTIRSAEKRAVRTSVWFSMALVACAGILGTVLLLPSHKELGQTTQRVAVLEGQMGEMQQDQRSLRDLIPANLGDTFAQLQQQASDIQGRIAGATAQAEQMAAGLIGQGSGDIASRLQALEQQVSGGIAAAGVPDLTALFDRVKQLQSSVEGQQQLATSVTDLRSLMDGLAGRVDNIDEALAGAQQEDDALGQTLAGVPPTDLRAAAMLLGLAQFRSSLNRNAPFEEDLLLLKGLVGTEDPALIEAIDRLAPRAAQGVLTPEGLSDQFKGLAGDIVVSSLKGEDVSIQEKARARFNEILQVQKDGELVSGTDTQATVARAQKMLDDGNIQAAIAELQTLDGPAKDTAQPFVDEALATMNAEKVKELLTGKVLGALQGVQRGGNAMPIARGGLESLLGEVEGMTRKVVGSPDSGVAILPQSPKVPGQ